ncbi:MAG: hypothetical protein COY38_03940 [Candidatus Aenigmarchaeota archaeon CG_4_10_14_0_8_um_filter_37_24]|nr:prepilin peptidase [Candidatus Aenigmarchaeota archaeon]OIN86579.1 MAG: hypothetical protein AUJ50_03780 [Candidatus Aenigmarchaeota archaeon CG1_02_38_14]PIV69400.1 MAG: hypothetical protein COS07_00920 [Candidatus Aenigmarchaeota archaeon CG01_land_8_20_14_3_00_37_9]PIW41714.1 MAG: hypothetical protein COW21_00465 [Candidatus Aenigmarchaeota archaeon CG15_BIG_FIL_POST_REV_8_21_14_020_37_27]PIX50539.1 MAG: hypothetical protein COZ52_03435 [Candidatus Aenigmarchaeota archaeon CG_4_8_14_3_um_
MIIESILLLVALGGSALAGAIDLKTTEIPDWIPYAMIGIGVVGNVIKSILVGSYTPILLSVAFGLGFLGFGFLLYYTGQWGGGDAKILSAIGFLLPEFSSAKSLFPFPLSFFFNVFFVGAFYMIFYSFILALFNRKIFSSFINDFRSKSKELLFLILSVFILITIFVILMSKFIPIFDILVFSSSVLALTIFMFTLWRFEKSVENVGFKRKIRLSELKEGDVLDDSKLWEGLTKKQVKEIKKSGKKYVVIKDGVRFAPVFAFALLMTIFLGDIVFWVVGLFY